MKQNNFKKGGVSMFIVIVTCVLVALLTASFVRMVNRDLSNASRQDLSQSAYDSAQAGVEDAKRFIRVWNSECHAGVNNNPNSEKCARMAQALDSGSCNMMSSAGIGSSDGETVIQTTSGTGTNNDAALNQAYTCVKIQANTPDYLGEIAEGESRTIQLKGIDDINSVEISWYSKEDLTNPTSTNVSLMAPATGNVLELPSRTQWNSAENRPPVMKAQFFGYIGGSLELLDESVFTNDINGINERIYYPTTVGSNSDVLPGSRKTGDSNSTSDLSAVRCRNLDTEQYACSVKVEIMQTISAYQPAFLRLTPIYSGANFRVKMMMGGKVIDFNGIQPIVDSTGRANDRLRRVESRIESEDMHFPIPEFAVQVDGNTALEKDFWVTNCRSEFNTAGSC